MTPGSEERREHTGPRRHTRRAVLAGGAAIAAGSAAAATMAVTLGGESEETPDVTGTESPAAAADATGVAPTATAATLADPDLPIESPYLRAAHLLRRAGFGGSRAEIEEFAALSREEAASRLLDYGIIANTALDERIVGGGFELVYGQGLRTDMVRWWLTRMAYTARPLEERMTLLWHGWLVSQVSQLNGALAGYMVRQIDLFREMALPVHDELVQAVSKDPAMMLYLNTAQSDPDHPNENYARELMELFTMGVDTYTEDDVREAARAFTGWRFSQPPRSMLTGDQEADRELRATWNPEFFKAPQRQDRGEKTFLGQTGAWDGEDIVRIIEEQIATGEFVARRLFREFVHDTPSEADVAALVEAWDSSGHDIREVLRTILVSDVFYSQAAYRAKIRSPVELLVGLVRGLEIETEFRIDVRTAETMGQVLFDPPNVAGWPGGPAWLSSGTLFARANFVDGLFGGSRGLPGRRQRDRVVNGGLVPPALLGQASAEDMVDTALTALVDGNVPETSREAIVEAAAGIDNEQERAQTVAYLVACSPEYQLV